MERNFGHVESIHKCVYIYIHNYMYIDIDTEM